MSTENPDEGRGPDAEFWESIYWLGEHWRIDHPEGCDAGMAEFFGRLIEPAPARRVIHLLMLSQGMPTEWTFDRFESAFRDGIPEWHHEVQIFRHMIRVGMLERDEATGLIRHRPPTS